MTGRGIFKSVGHDGDNDLAGTVGLVGIRQTIADPVNGVPNRIEKRSRISRHVGVGSKRNNLRNRDVVHGQQIFVIK